MNDEQFNTIDWDTAGWRDQAPSLHLKGDILSRIDKGAKTRRIRVLTLGFIGSGIGAAALSAVFLMGSAPVTLAQVIAADDKADSITIVNKRIMGPGKGDDLTFTSRLLGQTIRTEFGYSPADPRRGSFGYRDKNRVVGYLAEFKLAYVDETSKHYTIRMHQPKISNLLKDFKAAKVEKDFDWNGRTVTRFTYKVSLRGTDLDQELLADPKTNLPIKFTSMRDKGSWGDEWTYDYSQISPQVLEPVLPDGTLVIDNRKQREIMKPLVGQKIPFIQFSPSELIVPVSGLSLPKTGAPFSLKVTAKSGETKTFKGTYSPVTTPMMRISGKDFVSLGVSEQSLGWNDHWIGETTSGQLKILGKTYSFSNVPVILSASSYSLNEPYVINYRIYQSDMAAKKAASAKKRSVSIKVKPLG